MQSYDKLLQILSNETKKTINEMDIVTPSMYSSVFSEFATLRKYDLTEEVNITDNVLNNKLALLANMQTETFKNAQALSDNTDKAIYAINYKDENTLA